MIEVKIKETEEDGSDCGFDKLHDAIQEWIDSNGGNVTFMGSFVVLNDETDNKNQDNPIKESLNVALGSKVMIQVGLEVFMEFVEKEKKDFINW